LAVAPDPDLDIAIDPRLGDDTRQALAVGNVLAVEREDDVVRLDAAARRRALRLHARHQRTRRDLEAKAVRDILIDALDRHAEPAAPRLAELDQLGDHGPHLRRGGREPKADRAAGGRIDQRVDADHLALHVEERTAGIALVDRGVSL